MALTREEFTKQYTSAVNSGMSGGEAVNYLAQSSISANSSGNKSSQSYASSSTSTAQGQSKSNALSRDEFAKQYTSAINKGMSSDEAISGIAERTRYLDNAVSSVTGDYDLDAEGTSLLEFAKTTDDKKLAKLINKHVGKDAKKDNFFGQTAASFDSGRINELANQAWSKYAEDPTDNNRANAEAYSRLATYYGNVNAEALDDKNVQAKWISQDMARYAPQFIEQTKASAGKIAAGAGAGAIAGELLTPIPVIDGLIGAVAGGITGVAGGAIAGAKIGGIAGSAGYSYETMRGAAMQNLLQNPDVTVEQAQAASRDEAIVSAAIESLDTAVDLIGVIPGVGNAVKKLEVKALQKGVGAYLGNIAQEYGEEFVQEAISMANERRAENGTLDSGITGLLSEVKNVISEMISGEGEGKENLAQAREAGRGGAIIGGFMTPIGAVVNNNITAPFQRKAISTVNNLDPNPVRRAVNNELVNKYSTDIATREGSAIFQEHAEDIFYNAQRGNLLYTQDGRQVGLVTGRTDDGVILLVDGIPTTVIFGEHGGLVDPKSKLATYLKDGAFFADENYDPNETVEEQAEDTDTYDDTLDEQLDELGNELDEPIDLTDEDGTIDVSDEPPQNEPESASQTAEETTPETEQESVETPSDELNSNEENASEETDEISPEDAERLANAAEAPPEGVDETLEKARRKADEAREKAKNQNKEEPPQQKPKYKRGPLTDNEKIIEKDRKRLARENKSLRNRVKELSRQTKRTDVRTARESDVRKLATSLLKERGSKSNSVEVTRQIQELADYLIQHTGEDIDYNVVEEMADQIAGTILDGVSETYYAATKEVGEGVRDYLKSTPLKLAKENEHDVSQDFKQWKKDHRGVRFSKDGLSVDSAYQELATMYPGYFPDDITNVGDMVLRIAEVLDEAESTVIPLSMNEDVYNQALMEVSNQVLDSVLSDQVRETAPTYADRMAAKYDAMKSKLTRQAEEARRRGDEKLAQQKERDAARIEKLKEKVRQKDQKISDVRQQKQAKYDALKQQKNEQLDQLRKQKNERLKELQRKAMEDRKLAIAKEKADKWNKVESVKQHYQDMMARQESKRKSSATRKKIQRLTKDISTRLTKPTEGHYVPQELAKAAVELLESIDMNTGNEKTADKLNALSAAYNKLMSDPDYGKVVTSEVTQARLNDLAEYVGGTRLADMSEEQLNAVYDVVKGMSKEIRDAVKVRIRNEEYTASQLSAEWRKEVDDAKGWGKGWFGNLNRAYTSASLRGTTFLERLSGFKKDSTGKKMADMLNDGQRKSTAEKVRASRKFAELVNDKQSSTLRDTVSLGKDASGNDITVSRGMMLSLKMILDSEDGINHVKYGGLTIPGIDDYYKGTNDAGFGTTHRRALGVSPELAQAQREYRTIQKEYEKIDAETNKNLDWQRRIDDVVDRMDAKKAEIDAIYEKGGDYIEGLKSTIESKLTDYDRKWISTAREYFDEVQTMLNDTTMSVYGFKKALVENYFPLQTDPNFRTATFDSISKDMSLENSGFMKSRVKAANPIMLTDISEVIGRYSDNSSKYIGLMPAIRNFQKVYGKTSAGFEGSLQESLDQKFGKEASTYIENLLADLTGARKSGTDALSTLLAKTRGNMAQAVLSLNPRVALSQSASYLNAASEIGWEPLVKAFSMGTNPTKDAKVMDLITKYTPLEYYRTLGNSSVDLGDIKNDARMQNRVMKKFDFLMNWITAVDTNTVGRLWYASEAYVQKNNSELSQGSDAYYEEVAKVYNRVIERTQPNYTTMQRSGILRSPSDLVKSLTMFMTQRMQNYNILYEAGERLAKYQSDFSNNENSVTQADLDQARTDFRNAVTSQVASTATLVLFKAGVDALMHSMKGYRDDDDELTKKSISNKILDMFCDSLFGNFLGGTELYSLGKSLTTGSRYYGVSVSGIDTFSDVMSDIVDAYQASDDKKLEKWGKAAESISQLFGIPTANAMKFVEGIQKHAEDIENGEFLSYESDRKQQSLTVDFGYKDKYLLSPVVDRFTMSDESKAVEREIERLYTATGIKGVYPGIRWTTELSLDGKDYDLTEEEQERYRKTAGKQAEEFAYDLMNSKMYKSLTNEQKAAALKEVYGYAKDKAKDEFFSNRDIESSSDYKTLFTGVDKAGTTNDKVALEQKNLSDYVSYKIAFNAAVKAKDYDTLDSLIKQYNGLNANTKTVLSERTTNLDNLREYAAIGVSSKGYYALKEGISAAQIELDKNSNQGGDVQWLGLLKADMTSAEKKRVIEQSDFLTTGRKAVYDILSPYGFSMQQMYDFFEDADYRVKKETGEVVTSGKGQLDAAEAAVAISQLPGLSDNQRVAIYNAMKERMSNYFNDWKNYSYASELNYARNRSKYTYGRGTPNSYSQSRQPYNPFIRK